MELILIYVYNGCTVWTMQYESRMSKVWAYVLK
jgi:hypothetical protein